MEAVNLGPLVLSSSRLWVALALVVFIGAAEVLGRLKKLELSSWAWNSALLVIAGARLGFVLTHLGAYSREPLTIVYLWQGGFSPLWGLAASLSYSVWTFRKTPEVMRWASVAAGLGIVTWLLPMTLSFETERMVTLPTLELEQLSGDRIDLKDFAGQPVVLNLWATWCPPCRRELPLLLETARLTPDVAFIFINQAESADQVQSYLAERDLDMELALLDPQRRASDAFRAKGMPTTLFFSADGELSAAHLGELSRVALHNYLIALRP